MYLVVFGFVVFGRKIWTSFGHFHFWTKMYFVLG